MPKTTRDHESARPIVPQESRSLSDDECLARLARAIEAHDQQQLEDVVQLIGRLVATIE